MKYHKPRIYFFSPFCILRNSTNRIFDMRMCDAFAGAEAEVILTFPYFYMKENLKKRELFQAYNCKNTFTLRMQPTPLTSKTPDTLRTWVLLIAYSFTALRVWMENIFSSKRSIVVSRETIPLLPLLLLKKIFGRMIPLKVVIQLHELKSGRMHRWVYRHCDGLMPNVPRAKNILHERDGIPYEKMLAMNAPMVDFSATDCSRSEARKRIDVDPGLPLVVYTGKVGMRVAELNYILEAAALLPQYHFLFTGGRKEVVAHFEQVCAQRRIQNVTFTGFLTDITAVRNYQLAADALVSYYNTKDHLVDFNYPQKIQEYISTRNPLVTPDFGATREVITSDNAFIVEPDNPKSLAAGISEAIENKPLAEKKAAAAYETSRKTTFDYRIREFLDFFQSFR